MRLIAISLLFSFITVANAVEEIPSTLTQQYAKSIETLSDKFEECRSSEENINFDKLNELGLDKSQLKVVLAYQFSRLNFECSKKEYADYLIASKALNEFSADKGKEIVEKLDKIIASSERSRWDAIERYSVLPERVRVKVESSNLFNKPFNLFNALPLIGSSE